GLELLGRQILRALIHLGHGDTAHGISRGKLTDNPFWPENLAAAAGHLKHERYIVLLPLALSRTQDDKGRVRWTLFGGSEQGPAKAFWKSFADGGQSAGGDGADFFCRLLRTVYRESVQTPAELRGAGFRILADDKAPLELWRCDP